MNRRDFLAAIPVAATPSMALGAPGAATGDEAAIRSIVQRYVDARAFGETLGTIPRGGGEAAIIVRAWMNSPGHRAALLSPRFRRVGVGRRSSGAHRSVIAVDLASAR